MTRLLCLFVLTLLVSSAVAAEEEIIETVVAPATESNRRNTEGDLVVLEDGTYLLAWSDFFGGARDDSAARISAVRSTDEGRTWSTPKAIEPDTTAHYAYTSVRFDGHRALLTYYVARSGVLSLKFKSIPLAWFCQ